MLGRDYWRVKMQRLQLLFQQQPSQHRRWHLNYQFSHLYRVHKKPHADAVAADLLLGLPQLALNPVVSTHGGRHSAL